MLETQIRHEILAAGHDDALLENKVSELERKWGRKVFKEVLYVLTGKNFGEERSAQYWTKALLHRRSLEEQCGWKLSLRSALLDYLQQHAGELTNPVIIEADFLENIRLSSITDGLTGLFDQLYFKSHLEKSLKKLPKTKRSQAAIVLFDIDHFKQYNDRCGHLAGDEALSKVAEILRTQVRDGDIVARYGGEEFALFLPRTTRATAFSIAERIRKAIHDADFAGQALLDRGTLSVSGGIAIFPEDGESALALIDAADKELYQAKTRRNCIFPTASERRQVPRHKISSLVEFTRTGRAFESGIVFDISLKGISFSCSDNLGQKDKVTLRFQKPFWKDNFFCEGKVRQVRKLEETGLNLIGLEFEKLFEDFIRYIPGHSSRNPFH